MKANELNEASLREENETNAHPIKRIFRRPKKTAPDPEALRGWAKSAVKNRSKS